jgi:hypothetical protein
MVKQSKINSKQVHLMQREGHHVAISDVSLNLLCAELLD